MSDIGELASPPATIGEGPDPTPTGLRTQAKDTSDHVRGQTDFSTWDVPELYAAVLKYIDPYKGKGTETFGVSYAATQWDDLADVLLGENGLLAELKASCGRLSGGESPWIGDAATTFFDTANRLVGFIGAVGSAARQGAALTPQGGQSAFAGHTEKYASMTTVSAGLGDWMATVRSILDQSPFTNGGEPWSVDNRGDYPFETDVSWQDYLQSTEVVIPYRGFDHRYTLAQLVTQDFTVMNGKYSGRDVHTELREAYTQRQVEYLARNQRALFESLCRWTGEQYTYYYRYLPQAPDPLTLTKQSDTQSGPDSQFPAYSPVAMDIPAMDASSLGAAITDLPGTAGLPTTFGDAPGLDGIDGLTTPDWSSGLDTPTSTASWTPPAIGAGNPAGLDDVALGGLDPGRLTTGGFSNGGLTGGGSRNLANPALTPGGTTLPGTAGLTAAGATNAATAGVNGRTSPGMYPPPMYPPTSSAGGDKDRGSGSGLWEDDDFWRVDIECVPTVLTATATADA